eukprot:5679800-Amphidinium_carterae.2
MSFQSETFTSRGVGVQTSSRVLLAAFRQRWQRAWAWLLLARARFSKLSCAGRQSDLTRGSSTTWLRVAQDIP